MAFRERSTVTRRHRHGAFDCSSMEAGVPWRDWLGVSRRKRGCLKENRLKPSGYPRALRGWTAEASEPRRSGERDFRLETPRTLGYAEPTKRSVARGRDPLSQSFIEQCQDLRLGELFPVL